MIRSQPRSIGQVHRACTHDGRAVAVKVQYPGVDEAISADLANSDLLFGALSIVFPGMDPRPIAEELRGRISEELDYRVEADNQRLFVAEYADHPAIHVPGVVDELSTGRVLTTELAEGATWAELLTWSQQERDLAAETLYRFAFGGIYRLATFNGDPHPGNYLFKPEAGSHSSTSGSASGSLPTRWRASGTSSRPWCSIGTCEPSPRRPPGWEF